MFKRFIDAEQAKELAEELTKKGIKCQLIDDSLNKEITFSNNSELMIRQSDFEKANKLMDEKADELLVNINKEHYLFEFTNEELYDILTKPDAWNSLDYKLAQQILKDRGQEFDKDLLESLKQARIAEFSKPKKEQTIWIIVGYIFSFTISIIGLIFGWYLWRTKKTLPNGKKIYVYSESDRRHGKWIFFIGIILWPLALYIKFFNKLNF
jgi:ATP-dependent Zn protease